MNNIKKGSEQNLCGAIEQNLHIQEALMALLRLDEVACFPNNLWN